MNSIKSNRALLESTPKRFQQTYTLFAIAVFCCIFFTGCEGVRAHRMCKPGDILTLSIKPKRMKMPLATFEGAIRVGQEKAVIAEDITLTFAYVDVETAAPPVAVIGTAQPAPESENPANPPLRVAINA